MMTPTASRRDSEDRALDLSAHDRLCVAAEAVVCVKTLQRFLAGRTVRSTSRVRIERALRRLGLPRGDSTHTAR